RRRIAVGHALDEHAGIESQIARFGNPLTWTLSESGFQPQPAQTLDFRLTRSENFGLAGKSDLAGDACHLSAVVACTAAGGSYAAGRLKKPSSFPERLCTRAPRS